MNCFVRKNGTAVQRAIKGVVRKPALSREDGYLYVPLTNGKNEYVHRLVAEAFVPGDTSLTVNHDDGVKTNNRWTNLVWMTQGANNVHNYRVLGRKSTTRKPVLVNGVPYLSQSHAAKALGVRVSQVSKARRAGHRLHGLEVSA